MTRSLIVRHVMPHDLQAEEQQQEGGMPGDEEAVNAGQEVGGTGEWGRLLHCVESLEWVPKQQSSMH